MKKYFLLITFLFLVLSSIKGQIITANINKVIPCCSSFPIVYADSVDIDGDSIFEIKIQSSTGIDGYSFNSIPMPNVQTNGTVFYGASFPTTWWGAGLPSTIFSSWVGWLPNTGFRYMGFRKINAPNDTTYGWVKLDFIGNLNAPIDTMYMLEYAYNTLPNTPIFAGQISALSIKEFEEKSMLLFPNPAERTITIKNLNRINYSARLLDFYGRCIKHFSNTNEFEKQLDISNLTKGTYIVSIQTELNILSRLIIKE